MESEISDLIGINADHFIILMNEWMNGRRQQHGNKQLPFRIIKKLNKMEQQESNTDLKADINKYI